MDIAYSHILQSNLNKVNINHEKINHEKMKDKIQKEKKDNNCTKCGQQLYFCQCSSINDIIFKNFNFEKNNY